MDKSVRNGVVALGVALVMGFGAVAVMAQDKEAIVKDRQAAMKALGASMGAVKAYIDGTGDQAKATDAVTALVANAKTIHDRFPAGTGMAEFPGKSGAKPAIWTEWDKFLAAQKILVTEGEKLLTAVKGTDKAAVGAQFGVTGKEGCGTCHNAYREKIG